MRARSSPQPRYKHSSIDRRVPPRGQVFRLAPALSSGVQEAGERIWMTELQIVDRFREGTNSRAVLMALLEKEPTTMDEARRTALKAVEIEEASRSRDFENNSPYDRRMEELTGALNRLITRLDDRLPPRGNRTSREHPQPSRRLEGSSRKADHPLASATDVVIGDTPVINGAAMSIISKEVWDKLDVKDQGDAGLSQKWVLRLGRKGATLNARGAVSVPVALCSWTHRLPFVVAEDLSFPGILGMNFINECVEYIHAQEKYLKMRYGCHVKIARRRGPPGAMRCGETVGITDSVETVVITTLVSKATDCTDRSREKMADLLRRYAETISMSDDDLGHTSVVKHRREEVEGHVRRMLERGLIEPAEGPWSSPVVLAKKKEGSSRFCVDYRRLNEVTRKDAQPLPRIDATLDALAGSKWFTTLDLASGYWQVEVDKRDREKTAFATPLGLYQFKVMPFGLCNAPGTFQRLMERTLSGLVGKSCLVYLDDIIVFSATEEEHLIRLEEVFQRLKGVGLKIKPEKCQLMKKQWRTPRCVREVRQFLGLASYYRRFIKDFARVAGPLHELTRKGEKWQWGPRQEGTFTTLKNLLVSTLILGHPDFSRPFVLDVDASDTAIGAVLSQTMENGNQVVIAYISLVLTRPEQRYCVTRKEMLALVWAVKQFRLYLYGQKFTARTDHNSLRWL
ncbi:Retrovirus-related Pol polyprotein from transposon 17.6 [Trichinella britovi]|uniref:Retrovirus-related Pol polyprotein from transposon 17.6 n=1 Tax=Trichinella britovi TaxID=45882 RepID=A0A0V1C9F4_TRIBR|nr:Retrovirus-related Pol polyprotein from transposon 17.6 [Trichinella britovi]